MVALTRRGLVKLVVRRERRMLSESGRIGVDWGAVMGRVGAG
jgi:hypothetical protein